MRCRLAMPHAEHGASSHSSHIHQRTAPGTAAGGKRLSCPSGRMASALPSRVLGWRGHAECCPPQAPSWVLWPLPARAKGRAGGGDPRISPPPTSKSLRDDLGFVHRSRERSPVLAARPSVADALLPIYSPQHRSRLSSCPLWPKEAGGGQPVSSYLGFFCLFFSLLKINK